MKKGYLVSLVNSCLLCTNMFATTQLADVVITAKTKSEVIDTAGSFTIISAKEIKESNASSIQNILEETVGLNVTANSRSINGRKNITFRGMNPEHTAILINGRRVSNTDAQIGHSDFQYNWIPMDAIEKIEIVRGPMSSLYGSKALGGVVNVITKRPMNKFSGNIDIKYTHAVKQGGTGKDVSLNLSGKVTDKLSMSIYAEKKLLDEIDNKKGKNNPATADKHNDFNDSQAEGKNLTNVMLNLWYEIDDTQEISASILYGKEIRDAITMDVSETRQKSIDLTGLKFQDGTLSGSNVKQKASILVNNYFNKAYEIDKEHYSLEYNKSFDSVDLSLKAYTTRSDVHSGVFEYTHKLRDDIISAELEIDSFDKHYIVAGMDYRKEYYSKTYDNSSYTLDFTEIRNAAPVSVRPMIPDVIVDNENFSANISQYSFYLQDEYTANDKLLLTFGARIDKHEKFGAVVSPKAYAVYRLSENQRLKAGYGKGFNAPTLSQLSDKYKFANPNAGHAFEGNSKLKPETTNTYEVGYEFTNKMQSFKATYFYNDIKNLIGPKDSGRFTKETNIPISIYSNISSATVQGLELEYSKYDLLKDLDFSSSYTYLKTKNKETNRVLNFRPEHKINASLKYKITNTLKSLISVAYTGKQMNHFEDQYSTITNNDGIIYSDTSGKTLVNKKVSKLNGYATMKFQISNDFSKNLSARFGIDNLTNTQLEDAYNFQLRERTYYIGMNYKF